MLILPLETNGVILGLELSFKDEKHKKEVLQADKINTPANNISIGKTSFKRLENYTKFDKNPLAITRFIRNALYNSNINTVQITTNNYTNSEFYDVYQVPVPFSISTEEIDILYGSMVNAIRLTQPEKRQGEILSFKKIGLTNLFTEEVVQDMIILKENVTDLEQYHQLLQQNGYEDQLIALDFLDQLNFTIKNETVMTTRSLEATIRSFSLLHNNVNKKLQNYNQVAKENRNCYDLLSTAHNLVYNYSLSWPILTEEDKKILLKRMSK